MKPQAKDCEVYKTYLKITESNYGGILKSGFLEVGDFSKLNMTTPTVIYSIFRKLI